jgi:type II secretory pathway component GspD/PulD (secretin)
MEAQQQMMIQQQLAAQQGRQAPKPPTQSRSEVYLIANARRNSIIVNAPPDKMAIIAAFITRVDVASPNEEYQALTTRMKVYRLTSLEPKQFVSSLIALNVLEPTTRLESDDKNKSMIAYASLADHLTIQETLKKLDGSARQAEVITLRRLRAEEVAGTIRSLMGIDQDKKEDSRRNSFFDYYSQRNKEEKSKDSLRLGVNSSSNQLILWANEFESEEIKKLLLKLGEAPPDARSDQTVRVIDGNRSPQMRESLEKLKQTWERRGIELEIPAESEFEEEQSPAPSPSTAPSQSPNRSPSPNPANPPTPAPKKSALNNVGASRSAPAGVLVATEQTQDATQPPSEQKKSSEKSSEKNSVKLRFDEQGNLVLESSDPKILDQIEDWMLTNAPPQKEYDVFHIRHARPYWIKMNLEDYFKEDKKESDVVFRWLFDMDAPKQDEGPQLGKKRKLKFMSDSDSNTLLVSGAGEAQLKTIQPSTLSHTAQRVGLLV